GPVACDRDGNLVVAGPFEGPVVAVGHLLDHIHRVDFAGYVEFDQFHANASCRSGSPGAPAKGTHDEQFFFRTRTGRTFDATVPAGPPHPRTNPVSESCNKFSVLMPSRVTSPFFARSRKRVWKPSFTKHRSRW